MANCTKIAKEKMLKLYKITNPACCRTSASRAKEGEKIYLALFLSEKCVVNKIFCLG